MSEPGLFAQIMGHVAYTFLQIQPMLPTYAHLLIAATLPIIVASHASLCRPNSAAKPKKSKSGDQDEDDGPRMEGLGAYDALIFPLQAGIMLTILYYLIMWMKDPAMLNMILNFSLSFVSLFSLYQLLSDSMHFAHQLVFPTFYKGSGGIWHVNQAKRCTDFVIEPEGIVTKHRKSPLPSFLRRLPFASLLWSIRALPTPYNKASIRLHVHNVVALNFSLDLYDMLAALASITAVVLSNMLTPSPWYLTNILAFAFAYTSLQHISPTTFPIASLLLTALFIYDIVMVFYTPLMITVATQLDIPAKMVFPRPLSPDGKRTTAMLGLGDIVLPGLVMSLALRFDQYLHYLPLQKLSATGEIIIKSEYVAPGTHWSSRIWAGVNALPALKAGVFRKIYFTVSVVAYVLSLATTLLVNSIWDHPQPALMFLVPGVLGSIWGTALLRGELSTLVNFTDEEEVEEPKKDEKLLTPEGSDTEAVAVAEPASDSNKENSSPKAKPAPKSLLLSIFSENYTPSRLEKTLKDIQSPTFPGVGKNMDLFHFSITLPKRHASGEQAWVETASGIAEEKEFKKETGVGHTAKRLRTR